MIIKVNYTVSDIYMSTSVSPVYIKVVYSGTSSGGGTWGTITGTLSAQTDLQAALDLKVPTSRVLTINGVAFDLSANRSWTIAAGVSSVGLSMPSAFTVGSSPITSSGTLAVTGAGTTLQYIDGTGALQTLPTRLESDSLVATVRNQSGATMTKGTVVYISGATGNKPLISKALATGDATSAQTLGLLQTDIANNADGHIVIIGNVTDLDTSALTEGQQLYLSGTTAGTYTSTKPYAPIHLVYVAIVIRSHPTQGTLSVKIQNGFEMDELHNVSAQSPANNDGLFWNASTSLWSKNTIAGVLGYTPQAALTLTTTGTSGAATLVGATLNIPQYAASMAIGGSITSATAGSVLFAGTSGVLAQSNANLFWDNTNLRLGIGKTSPQVPLDVVGFVSVRNTATNSGTGYGIEMATNSSIPRVDFVVNGVYIGQFASIASDLRLTNNLATTGGFIFDAAIGSGAVSTRMKLTSAGRLLIGTTVESFYLLDVNGTARIVSKLFLNAGTTSNAQINLASSTAPTSPNNGDIWFDGTNIKMQIGGVTKTFTLI